ncbi:Do family serine endopeptidase [Catalinimonas niigatensis]|uniref:Do family serine endopeptidase n=1 Tax=Catalinimonas niigatensis TaxID=1397264 RepID=UPI002666749B|nr:Do family serine endopeptidase [Catalinimonas niigatensis]WPP49684.1 Do family serine endopeptidase [Catalinimonas niigatensis]
MKNIITPVISAVIASLLTIAAFYFFAGDKLGQQHQQDSDAFPAYAASYYDNESTSAPDTPFDFTLAAEKATPAVVHITSTQEAVARNDQQQQQIPEFFRDFFGDQLPQQQQRGPRMGSGSGVIISEDGFIITNNHVVADADELTVVLVDNRSYVATVVGTDPTTDLALIKIDEEALPFLKFANSEDVKVGQWVAAIGNPFRGLNSTVTAGIVSATGRNINILRDQQYAIESFIQTDAAVNPGNSGGALVNMDGDMVGINSAIASPTGAYAGYAFAVPSNIATKVVSDLKEFGSVQRGFLGVSIQEVNAALAEEYDLNTNQGVYVAELVESGSAAAAGIEKGDVIVQVDNKKINQTSDLLSYIGRKRPGDEVEVIVLRNGERQNYTMELKTLEGTAKIASSTRVEALEELGADFQTLTEEEAEELNVEGGVKVVRTFAGKFRQQGIRPGFIITGIAGKPVRSVEDLTEVVENERGGVLVEGIYPDSADEKQYYGMPL